MQSFLSSQYPNALGDYDFDVTSAVFQTDYDTYFICLSHHPCMPISRSAFVHGFGSCSIYLKPLLDFDRFTTDVL